MAIYETGTSTDVADLLVKLRAFALANGWTVHFAGTRTSGSGQALQLGKGGLAGTFLTNPSAGNSTDPGPYIGTYCHDAYNAANGTENQAARSATTWSNAMAGAFQAHHFFTGSAGDPPYLYVVVETAPGVFKHFGIGRLVTAGTINTGAFCHALNWSYDPNDISNWTYGDHAVPFDGGESSSRNGPSTQVRADCDGIAPRWYDFYSNSGNSIVGGFRRDDLWATVPSNVRFATSGMTKSSVRTHCLLLGQRLNGVYSPLGYPPGIRWCRLDDVPPGHQATVGGVTWKLFPLIRKNGSSGQPNSDTYGYAYRTN